MNKEQERIHYLFHKYVDKTISLLERKELWGWAQQEGNFDILKEFIRWEIEKMESGAVSINKEKTQTEADKIFSRILAEAEQMKTVTPDQRTKIIPFDGSFKKAQWKRWAVAASIIFLVAVGGYFAFFNKDAKRPDLANLPQQQRFANDIIPAKQQIVITLADGSKRVLDSAENGMLAIQGNSQLIKNNNELSYISGGDAKVVYNSIQTGKGRTLYLRLADGTDVWLDAMSSIYFPTAFPGENRVVEVTGQAYFEVAKNPKQPFKVKTGNQVVEVLGTHFNVNAYEAIVRTTLIEGSVQVKSVVGSNMSEVKIKPGQQAILTSNQQLVTSNDADLEEVMAWKNGRFLFNESSVDEIMSQLSRWYDIEVIYKDKINKAFVAKIERDMPVSKLLALLEMTNQIKFTIDGNKVTVMKW